ncbi:salivary glue protein Sgs-3-like isoform X1 [Biomphalaria glabrata]|uniref:Salivary glue protein Sgs-3-like isoform X1 n=1 Tax=Biomphalaria glabrata TaxID=6526 RepID=A0A9W3AY71_BIOGL|nr:salivary glue protein Sgs-3-like isoform X1 [Biomphalaria glabrata]
MAQSKVFTLCALIVLVGLLLLVESKSAQRARLIQSRLVVKKTLAPSRSSPRPTYQGHALRLVTSATRRAKHFKALVNTVTTSRTTPVITTSRATTKVTTKTTTRHVTTQKTVTTPKTTPRTTTRPTVPTITSKSTSVKISTTFKTTPTSAPRTTSKSTGPTQRTTPRTGTTPKSAPSTTSKSTGPTQRTTPGTGTTLKSTPRTTPRTSWTSKSTKGPQSTTYRSTPRGSSTPVKSSTPSHSNRFQEALLQCSPHCKEGITICSQLTQTTNSMFTHQQYCPFMNYQMSSQSIYKCLLDVNYCSVAEYHKLKTAACNNSNIKNPFTFLIAIFVMLATALKGV